MKNKANQSVNIVVLVNIVTGDCRVANAETLAVHPSLAAPTEMRELAQKILEDRLDAASLVASMEDGVVRATHSDGALYELEVGWFVGCVKETPYDRPNIFLRRDLEAILARLEYRDPHWSPPGRLDRALVRLNEEITNLGLDEYEPMTLSVYEQVSNLVDPHRELSLKEELNLLELVSLFIEQVGPVLPTIQAIEHCADAFAWHTVFGPSFERQVETEETQTND